MLATRTGRNAHDAPYVRHWAGGGTGLSLVALLVALCLMGLTVLACDGSAGNTTPVTDIQRPGNAASTDSASTDSASTDPASPLSPADLGDAVGRTWSEAIQMLVALLRARPDMATVRPQVSALKEEYVQKLVKLGRQVAKLQLDGKAVVDSRIEAALEAAADAEWFAEYVDIYDDYSDGDLEFANLLASFNILTQYADFELLKAQDPEEAARLGIE